MLDSNLFTHRNTYAILREATSETYGPRVYLLSYKYQKYLSYLIISIRSHFCKLPWRDWQPLYCVGCEVLVCLCRCVGLLRSLLLDWYLGSHKNWGKYLRYFAASPFPLQGKPTQAQDVARRIYGAIAEEVFAQVKTYQIPITNSSPSHYIICHLPLHHFTLAILFALSFTFASFSLASCVLVCWIACHDGSI